MSTSAKPPATGYFPFTASGDFPVPAGRFASLPGDASAAAMVHRSSWEPRPENTKANLTQPPSTFRLVGPSAYPPALWARITGRCPLPNPTTDELIQWVAAKWGLADSLIRAEMTTESHWYQNLTWLGIMPAGVVRRIGSRPATSPLGSPVYGHGYGDYAPGRTGLIPAVKGSPNAAPASQYSHALGGHLIDTHKTNTGLLDRIDGPASFGMPQCKWWVWRLNGGQGTGLGAYPWVELSTGLALDLYAAVIRADYEGWNEWPSGTAYASYKLKPGGSYGVWGAVGRWFSGAWYSGPAKTYIANVEANLANEPWLQVGF